MSRRTEILRRATEVFERQGVSRTSIEDIAKAVGIKREAIYYYFKSRADILLEITLPESTSLLRGLRAVARSNLSSRDKLHDAIQNHLDSFNPSYLEMSVALREDHFFQDDEKLGELKRVWKDYNDQWIELIREGQADGSFHPDLDPKVVVFGLLGMLNWVSRWFQPGKGVTIPEIIETYFTLATKGLCTDQANLTTPA